MKSSSTWIHHGLLHLLVVVVLIHLLRCFREDRVVLLLLLFLLLVLLLLIRLLVHHHLIRVVLIMVMMDCYCLCNDLLLVLIWLAVVLFTATALFHEAAHQDKDNDHDYNEERDHPAKRGTVLIMHYHGVIEVAVIVVVRVVIDQNDGHIVVMIRTVVIVAA